jgi:hypothetical protein
LVSREVQAVAAWLGRRPIGAKVSWELDHVFFATADPEGAERAFERVGITFDRRTIHAGQGTANASARFENAFVEILYAHDPAELRSDLVRPLGLSERIRWRETGACPFGLCFRPTVAAEEASRPFTTWPYAAAYLPAGANIPIVTPRAALAEPLVFLSGDPAPAWRTKRNGLRRRLTGIRIRRPAAPNLPLSAGVRWFSDRGLFVVEDGGDHQLELEWDDGCHSEMSSLAPETPIDLRW